MFDRGVSGDESGVVLRDSEVFGKFLICLTIYLLYWLRDILMVCRSGCRSGLLNCVEIWCNFVVDRDV